jgi:hypothetical protein
MLTNEEHKKLLNKIEKLEQALEAINMVSCDYFDSCVKCGESCHQCGATKLQHELADKARKLIK